ncbi:MAG: L,D-transpeptidase family protein [Pseudomonadota bacterium]
MTILRMKRSLHLIGLLALSVGAVFSPVPGYAQGPNDWMAGAFGQTTSSGYLDRTFARRWQANPPKGFPTLSPANVDATKKAIQRYNKIVKAGGWPKIPKGKLEGGSSGDAIKRLRQRLTASGDLTESPYWGEGHYGVGLETAVKRFQATNGLAPTGIVDKRTLAALNVPAKDRLKQLKLGLKRLRQYVRKTKSKRYVAVNIPSAQVEAVEGDRIVSRHAGVVGKIDRKTPLLTSRIHELNFNPVWRLPPTVVNKDLIPKGRSMHRKGQSVLVKYGIDAYDGSGKKVNPQKINWTSSRPFSLSYRQQPGEDNPLGFVKINFHNAHSVYLHDTPSDSIFGRNFRAASSGCIRVQNVEQLVTWILNGQDGWERYKVDAIKESGKRKDVRVKKPVKLYFTYITAWATKDGVIQFRRDLYRKDRVSKLASAY